MADNTQRNTGFFDRFAASVATELARARAFVASVLLVLIWVPSIFVFGSVDTWQLIINTATTILTFLMVALLQNTQDRAVRALQHKLDAIAEGLAEVLDQTDGVDESGDLATSLRDIAGVELEAST